MIGSASLIGLFLWVFHDAAAVSCPIHPTARNARGAAPRSPVPVVEYVNANRVDAVHAFIRHGLLPPFAADIKTGRIAAPTPPDSLPRPGAAFHRFADIVPEQ
jgi:hypothetical protein